MMARAAFSSPIMKLDSNKDSYDLTYPHEVLTLEVGMLGGREMVSSSSWRIGLP